MCGIIGFNWDNRNLLNKALKKINHRGPNASGKYIDKNISLGHKRLSIIDLSKSGKQPMSNEDGRIWIIYNGEIYNFKSIREELEKKGHRFKSNTDTEVLLHLYEEHSKNNSFDKMLNQLNGMFSFCIYDLKKRKLFLARDRIGIKPLYYYLNNKNKKFMFSSEIKAILENKSIKREINKKAISYFLSFRANTSEKTLFQDIYKLMPGNYLIYDLKQKKLIKKQKYWDINFSNKTNYKKYSEKYYVEKLKSLLLDSVKKRLMSDVPFGAYLSGGIDSGTIVSLMNKFCSKPVETFSVGFDTTKYNELNDAKFLAEKLSTNHHELIIKEDSVKHLPEIIYQQDEPMADPTSLPIYLLSKFAKKRCTVILTGEGSDEIFAGYPQYKFMLLHKKFIRPLPKFSRNLFPFMIKNIPKPLLDQGFRYSSDLGEKAIDRFSNFIKTNNYSKQYLNQVGIFNEQEKRQLFLSKYNQNLYKKYEKYFNNNSHIINNCSYLDLKENMVEDLLMKVDKNTMASAIESRVPFLDHRIVALAFNLPSNLKLKNFTKDKFILRKAMKGLLPEQTRKRKKKHFIVPINNWFQNELLQLKQELLSENFIKKQNLFDYKYVRHINKNFKASPLFYSRQLWSLITFQIWYKQYIKNEKIKI